MSAAARITPISPDLIPAELREELGLADDEVIVLDRSGGHLLVRRATIVAGGDEASLPTYRLGRPLTLDETIRLEKEATAYAIAQEGVRYES